MTTYSITITDQGQLDGIAAQLASYNSNNPQNQLNADTDYFNWFMSSQFAQWSQQNTDANFTAAVQAAEAGDATTLIALLPSVATAVSTLNTASPALV